MDLQPSAGPKVIGPGAHILHGIRINNSLGKERPVRAATHGLLAEHDRSGRFNTPATAKCNENPKRSLKMPDDIAKFLMLDCRIPEAQNICLSEKGAPQPGLAEFSPGGVFPGAFPSGSKNVARSGKMGFGVESSVSGRIDLGGETW